MKSMPVKNLDLKSWVDRKSSILYLLIFVEGSLKIQFQMEKTMQVNFLERVVNYLDRRRDKIYCHPESYFAPDNGEHRNLIIGFTHIDEWKGDKVSDNVRNFIKNVNIWNESISNYEVTPFKTVSDVSNDELTI